MFCGDMWTGSNFEWSQQQQHKLTKGSIDTKHPTTPFGYLTSHHHHQRDDVMAYSKVSLRSITLRAIGTSDEEENCWVEILLPLKEIGFVIIAWESEMMCSALQFHQQQAEELKSDWVVLLLLLGSVGAMMMEENVIFKLNRWKAKHLGK